MIVNRNGKQTQYKETLSLWEFQWFSFKKKNITLTSHLLIHTQAKRRE